MDYSRGQAQYEGFENYFGHKDLDYHRSQGKSDQEILSWLDANSDKLRGDNVKGGGGLYDELSRSVSSSSGGYGRSAPLQMPTMPEVPEFMKGGGGTKTPVRESQIDVFDPTGDYDGYLDIDNSFNTMMNQQNQTQNVNTTNVGSGNTIYGGVGNQSNYTLNSQYNSDEKKSQAKERAQNYALQLM